MRPCQFCPAAIPNHLKVCPECGQKQLLTVGANAVDNAELCARNQSQPSDSEAPDPVGLAMMYFHFAPFLLVALMGFAGYMAFGGAGFIVGAGLAFAAVITVLSICSG